MQIIHRQYIYLLFFLGALFLPIPSRAIVVFKEDSTQTNRVKKAKTLVLKNEVEHFVRKQYLKKQDNDKKAKRKKIWRYIIGSIIGVVLFWSLQGSIWLFFLSLLSFFTYKLWQRNRYKNPPTSKEEYVYQGQSNSYSRKSIRAFLWGLLLWAFLILLGFILQVVEGGIIALFFTLFTAGFILILIGVIRAIKSLILREPDNTAAIIVLVLGILLLLPTLFTFLLGFLTLLF